MQREIKFRAWDKENEEMVPNVVPIEDRCWIDIGMVGEHGELENEHVIMQFTGLKDKNGKEIYEGDIIELKQWNPNRYFIDFVEGGFCFKTKGALSTDINMIQDSTGIHAEVIGNIYENPALLSNPQ